MSSSEDNGHTEISRLHDILEILVEPESPNFRSILNRLVSEVAREQRITFLGAYQQESSIGPLGMIVPFLLTQTQQQKEALKQGILTATGYDVGSSLITGKITPERVSFKKVYNNKEINPSPISYRGHFLRRDIYEGEWSFGDLPLEVEYKRNLKKQGHFRLTKLS